MPDWCLLHDESSSQCRTGWSKYKPPGLWGPRPVMVNSDGRNWWNIQACVLISLWRSAAATALIQILRWIRLDMWGLTSNRWNTEIAVSHILVTGLQGIFFSIKSVWQNYGPSLLNTDQNKPSSVILPLYCAWNGFSAILVHFFVCKPSMQLMTN